MCMNCEPKVTNDRTRMAMAQDQSFADPDSIDWMTIDFLPGVTLMPLAQPVPDGSIHRARLAAGTVIPAHTHPADEYVLVLSGTAAKVFADETEEVKG